MTINEQVEGLRAQNEALVRRHKKILFGFLDAVPVGVILEYLEIRYQIEQTTPADEPPGE